MNITFDCESLLGNHTSHKSGEFDDGVRHIHPCGDEDTLLRGHRCQRLWRGLCCATSRHPFPAIMERQLTSDVQKVWRVSARLMM